MIYFRCGRCAAAVRADNDQAGLPVTCPRCGHGNVCPDRAVPAVTEVSAPQPPASTGRPAAPASAWILAGLVVLAAGGYGAWASFLAFDRAGTRQLSPVEARQQELLQANIGEPGDPQLGQLYLTLNARHFDNALPSMPVRWEPRLADVGGLAAEAFTLEGMFGHVGPKTTILLNPDLQRDMAALTRALCHEMVHAFLYTTGDTTTNHGPAFQSVLQRLSREGAFEGLFATDADRATLKAWLDEESARLDAEHEAMTREGEAIERERVDLEHAIADLNARMAAAAAEGHAWTDAGEIESLNARRDAYNARVAEANGRVARDRDAVAAFNRQVDRYRLMASYPDGIDEEDLVRPRAVIRP